MTEAEWLACGNPKRMCRHLGRWAHQRKQRLFAVACCRRIAGSLSPTALRAVDAAEAFADGLIAEGGLGA